MNGTKIMFMHVVCPRLVGVVLYFLRVYIYVIKRIKHGNFEIQLKFFIIRHTQLQ